MKTTFSLLCVFVMMAFMLIPASADTMPTALNTPGQGGADPGSMCSGSNVVYCNPYADPNGGTGAINGNTDAWTINFGFAVSDSFTLAGSETLTAADFGVWLEPGDSIKNVDWCVSTADLCGGTVVGSATGASVSAGPADECQGMNMAGHPAGGNCDLGGNQFGFDIQSVEVGFGAGVAVGPGTYYLTLQNASAPSGDPIYWDENEGPSSAVESSLGTIPSEAFAVDAATSSVPEPQSLVLFGFVALLFGFALRRKLRSA